MEMNRRERAHMILDAIIAYGHGIGIEGVDCRELYWQKTPGISRPQKAGYAISVDGERFRALDVTFTDCAFLVYERHFTVGENDFTF